MNTETTHSALDRLVDRLLDMDCRQKLGEDTAQGWRDLQTQLTGVNQLASERLTELTQTVQDAP